MQMVFNPQQITAQNNMQNSNLTSSKLLNPDITYGNNQISTTNQQMQMIFNPQPIAALNNIQNSK